MIIKRKFYNNDTVKIAKDLLGCFLVRKYRGKIIKAMITETEAYRGHYDLASHASRGKTERNKIMFGKAGKAYIYLVYGMHYMLNIVTEEKDFPAAVLIRGAKLLGHPMSKCKMTSDVLVLDGPAKLTKYLHINKSLNGHNLTKGEKLWIEKRHPMSKGKKTSDVSHFEIIKSPRIGVDYAKHCKNWKWNFKAVLC